MSFSHRRAYSAQLCLTIAVTMAAFTVHAAPVTINGATFDVPASCQAAEGALVCKLDGQQLELWISRKPLPEVTGSASTLFMRRMGQFNQTHDAAVANIMRSTGNDSKTPFENYGPYSALGALITSKSTATPAAPRPVVRFASVLHDEEVWQFLEAVATRTPAVEALSDALQRSLTLPPSRVVATAADVPQTSSAGTAATTAQTAPEAPRSSSTLNAVLLTLQYPLYLRAEVAENTADTLVVHFKRRSHAGGPNVTLSLRTPAGKPAIAAIIAAQKTAATGSMTGQTASVDVNRFGSISGSGFALLGALDVKKGLSGVESLETFFAAEVNGRLLEVRMTAEQTLTADAQATWAMLGNSLTLAK